MFHRNQHSLGVTNNDANANRSLIQAALPNSWVILIIVVGMTMTCISYFYFDAMKHGAILEKSRIESETKITLKEMDSKMQEKDIRLKEKQIESNKNLKEKEIESNERLKNKEMESNERIENNRIKGEIEKSRYSNDTAKDISKYANDTALAIAALKNRQRGYEAVLSKIKKQCILEKIESKKKEKENSKGWIQIWGINDTLTIEEQNEIIYDCSRIYELYF